MRPDKLDRRLFDRLAGNTGESLVSIYMPTHVKGAEIRQDRIRLKNGLAKADTRLEKAGWTPKDRAARLEPARALLDDEEFWRHQGPGLAILIDEDAETTAVALATAAEERVVVSGVFHLRPMTPSLRTAELPVLVLTKGGVRLYRSSKHEVSTVEADLPESFEDVNWFVDRERQRQRHPDRTGTKRARHGHEGGYQEEDLDRFLRAVAEALPDPDGDGPLVVLGDDNLAARFGKISEREIVSPDNSGVDDIDDTSEIRGRTAPVVESHEASLIQDRLREAKQHLGTGTAITDLSEALQAAVAGRIATLLLDAHAEPVWGEFDPETLEISRDDGPFASDLLDRLAVHAHGTGAEVVATDGPVEDHLFVAVPRF